MYVYVYIVFVFVTVCVSECLIAVWAITCAPRRVSGCIFAGIEAPFLEADAADLCQVSAKECISKWMRVFS